MKTKSITVARDDLPAFYHTATLASGDAQKFLLLLIKLSIFSLSLGAIFSAINTSGALVQYQFIVAFASSISLTISICMTFAIELAKYEKRWYDGRAIAESVKTIAWRFMMNSEPYFSLNHKDAEERFRQDLFDIKNARRSFGELLGGDTATKPQITDTMRSLRKADLDTRKDTYRVNRIEGQKKWYAANSKTNNEKGGRFFWLMIVLQLLAIIFAIFITHSPNFIFNPTGVITTLVAGIIAWMQVKQYKNLAESYGLTTHELGIIESKIGSISTNQVFADFVVESETAISREHTLWLARRTSN